MMNSIYFGFSYKDASIWVSSLITKGPCGSPSCRINDTSSDSSEVRRIWPNTTNLSIHYNIPELYLPSLDCILLMRRSSNKYGMRTTNRSKGANSIFICRTHEYSSGSNIYVNNMSNERCTDANDSTWASVFCSVFASENSL